MNPFQSAAIERVSQERERAQRNALGLVGRGARKKHAGQSCPSGQGVASARLEWTTEEGDTRTDSGLVVIVTIGKTSDDRRDLSRLIKRLRSQGHAIACNPIKGAGVTSADNTYCKVTGAVLPRADTTVYPTDYQVIGAQDVLQNLVVTDRVVLDYSFPLSIRIPTGAQGSGDEKVKPSPDSTFGTKNQVASTQAALAKQTADAVRSLLKE